MIDRNAVLKQLEVVSSKLFAHVTDADDFLMQEWQKIAQDPTFRDRAGEAQSSFLVPTWQGDLQQTFSVGPIEHPYTVLGVDGSQIYPDRHISGAGCCLINVGGILIEYDAVSRVQTFSKPEVLLLEQLTAGDEQEAATPEMVDFTREARELATMLQQARGYRAQNSSASSTMPICLVDGSLIFWQLEGSSPAVKKRFLDAYLGVLDACYQERILVAGYISFPRSKELINLIKLGLCRFKMANCIPCHSAYTTFPCETADQWLDSQLVHAYVPPWHRTILFASSSKIIKHYPSHLAPHFLYLNVGKEVARVEIPRWIAYDETALTQTLSVIVDQVQKGQGFPVVLAEAHEQAVVKGSDREFFYHLIAKICMAQHKPVSWSQKSLTKKFTKV